VDESLPTSAAAERNKQPILEILQAVLPPVGTVLEVASGTGQHVVHFASGLPDLRWQPTEADPSRCRIVAARRARSALPNVLWPVPSPVEAVVCINMIHIAPVSATRALLAGARRVLRADGGLLCLYGPFTEGGAHGAASNAAFDESLRQQNREWGVRDLGEVLGWAMEHGFERLSVTRMPANNLAVVCRLKAS
jgi:SAM-dependent methyltransferase